MEEKELDLVVTAKWIDEEGKEYEKNIQIDDIIHQKSIVIELKTVENTPIIEEKEEQIIFPIVSDTIDTRMYVDSFPRMLEACQFLKKNSMERNMSNELLYRQKMSTYYMYNMQSYWEYLYAISEKMQ